VTLDFGVAVGVGWLSPLSLSLSLQADSSGAIRCGLLLGLRSFFPFYGLSSIGLLTILSSFSVEYFGLIFFHGL
jgi:hypothetical protein